MIQFDEPNFSDGLVQPPTKTAWRLEVISIVQHWCFIKSWGVDGRNPSNSDGMDKETCTLRKFNIAPENIPSQKESSLPTIIFQGRAVKLPGCKIVGENYQSQLVSQMNHPSTTFRFLGWLKHLHWTRGIDHHNVVRYGKWILSMNCVVWILKINKKLDDSPSILVWFQVPLMNIERERVVIYVVPTGLEDDFEQF